MDAANPPVNTPFQELMDPPRPQSTSCSCGSLISSSFPLSVSAFPISADCAGLGNAMVQNDVTNKPSIDCCFQGCHALRSLLNGCRFNDRNSDYDPRGCFLSLIFTSKDAITQIAATLRFNLGGSRTDSLCEVDQRCCCLVLYSHEGRVDGCVDSLTCLSEGVLIGEETEWSIGTS
jgi:hypothetical protein